MLLLVVAVSASLGGFYTARLLWHSPSAKHDAERPQTEEGAPAEARVPPPPADLVPDPTSPLPERAEALIEEANRVVDRLVEAFPNSPDSLEMKARVQDWIGNSEEAVRCWEKCLDLNRDYAYAYGGIATIAAKKGEHEKAAEMAEKALRVDPAYFLARTVRAKALIDLARPEEAISLLEEYLRTDPRSQGFVLLGQAYSQTGEHEKAKENYEAAIERYPEYTGAYHGLSRACARLGRQDAARQAMAKYRELRATEKPARQGTDMVKDDLEATYRSAAIFYTDIGRLYYSQREPREAERLWRRAAVLVPEDVGCRQALAWLCRGEGRTQETIELMEEMASIEPENPGYWIEIGRLWAEMVQLEPAEKALRKACAVAPQNAEGHAALARLYLTIGRNPAEALTLARTAVQLQPTAANYALLAAACERNDDHPGAVAAREQAAKLESVRSVDQPVR
ncbi:MAG: tetratricopeptide repeat protein [Planctomycetota bacterium]